MIWIGYELKWSPSKVRRFLKKLQKDNMITIHNEKRWTHLSINNYDTYQDVRHGDETPATRERIIGENNIRMNKNEKNEKTEKTETWVQFSSLRARTCVCVRS